MCVCVCVRVCVCVCVRAPEAHATPALSGLDPVPLSKIGTRLLASLGIKGKNRNPLA